MRTVFLCGFMGCGKSTIGKALAEELGLPFFDLDEEIVQGEKMSIPDIFSQKGEAHFRALEEKYIRKISENGGIVATGGGAMTIPETAAAARALGAVVFLDVPFEVCYERIRGDENRPLAANSTKEQLLELFLRRRKIYLQNSDFAVDANCKVKEAAQKIKELLDAGSKNSDF